LRLTLAVEAADLGLGMAGEGEYGMPKSPLPLLV